MTQTQTYKNLKYRSKIEIFGTILEAAASGEVTKSNISHASFLSYQTRGIHIITLIENDLMTEESLGNKTVYKTTDKGIRFLQMYNGITELVSIP